MTDIGFSGMRSANRTSADQPVASAIGTSGTSARAEAAEGDEQHERDGREAGQQRLQPPPRLGDRGVRPAASTGSPTSCACTPGGRVQASRIVVDHAAAGSSSPIRRMPNASVATRRSGVITSWEKYGGIASSSARDRACGVARAAAR